MAKFAKKIKRSSIADHRRKALMTWFENKSKSEIISFLYVWFKNSEVKHICEEEGIEVPNYD